MNIDVGDTVHCWNEAEQNYLSAEILKVKDTPKIGRQYFVHFRDINKRFDDWVTQSSFDMKTYRKARPKKKDPDDESDDDYYGTYRNINYLRFGDYLMKAWYFSPVPEPYFDVDTLYCCEFCMRFFATEEVYYEHCRRCKVTHPPGDEIYRKGNLSAYELDGEVADRWCQNLCLVTKLFLNHKFAYYPEVIQDFLFYVLCFNDSSGAHPCGFFSKEKDLACANNLSCILAFPCYQNKGLGRCLIQLSYELSKIEKKAGGPEKPLSDLGLLAYTSYWKAAVMKSILTHRGEKLSIQLISEETGMTEEDVKEGIKAGNFLYRQDAGFVFGATDKQIIEYKEKEKRRVFSIDPRFIRWSPFPRVSKRTK